MCVWGVIVCGGGGENMRVRAFVCVLVCVCVRTCVCVCVREGGRVHLQRLSYVGQHSSCQYWTSGDGGGGGGMVVWNSQRQEYVQSSSQYTTSGVVVYVCVGGGGGWRSLRVNFGKSDHMCTPLQLLSLITIDGRTRYQAPVPVAQ